jgi:LysM repeat protein
MNFSLLARISLILMLLFSVAYVAMAQDQEDDTTQDDANATQNQEGIGTLQNATGQNQEDAVDQNQPETTDQTGTATQSVTGQNQDTSPGNAAESNQGGGANQVEPLAGDVSYIVQPGDVLDLIGAGFNVSASCIAETNNLENAGRIFPGDELIIRASCPPYDGFALDNGAETSVEAGSQAAQFDAGQGGGGAEPGPGDQTYVIQPGDTLDGIAQEFNISLISLQQVNNLFDFRDVVPGLTIVIPGDAPPYGVVPPTQDIQGQQPVNIGQGGGGTASTQGQGGGEVSQTAGSNIYTVEAGDTLLTIAARFGVTPAQLAAANELFSSIELETGTELVIP